MDEKWTLVICLYKDEVTGHCSHWPSTYLPWKEFEVESKNEALNSLGKTGGQISDRYFQEILWALFPVSSYMWKSTKIMNNDICSSWPAATFSCAGLHVSLPPESQLRWRQNSLSQRRRARVPPGVLRKPGHNLNSHVSCCVFSFRRHWP